MALERLARLKNERKAIAETPLLEWLPTLVVSLRKGAIGSRHDYRLTHRHAAVKTRIANAEPSTAHI
jgi:hypothetical protein